MPKPLRDLTKMFWSVALFTRRAPDPYRNKENSIVVLENIAVQAKGKVQERAVNLLREITGTEPDDKSEPPRAG